MYKPTVGQEAKMSTRDIIIEKAYYFFSMKGYKSTSIKDIIESVGVAKGTFYHYFNSKSELLDIVVEEILCRETKKIREAIDRFDGNAIEMFKVFFDMQSKWKYAEANVLFEMMKVMYSDENVLFLKKIEEKSKKYFGPILAEIIRRGIKEGSFNTFAPEEASNIIMTLSFALGEEINDIFMNNEQYEDPVGELERKMDVIFKSMGRILDIDYKLFEFEINDIEDWVEFFNNRKE